MPLKCEVCGTLQKGNFIPRKCQGCGQGDLSKYIRVEAEVNQTRHDRDRAYLEGRRRRVTLTTARPARPRSRLPGRQEGTMKRSKEEALKTIRDVKLTEYLMYNSDVIDPISHASLCGIFQHLERLAEKSTLSEFEGPT